MARPAYLPDPGTSAVAVLRRPQRDLETSSSCQSIPAHSSPTFEPTLRRRVWRRNISPPSCLLTYLRSRKGLRGYWACKYRLLSAWRLAESSNPIATAYGHDPLLINHRKCHAMLRRTTVRHETDRAHHSALPTDAPQLLRQDTAAAPQISIEAAQMRPVAQDHNSMEAGLRSLRVRLDLVHHVAATLDVAKFEN